MWINLAKSSKLFILGAIIYITGLIMLGVGGVVIDTLAFIVLIIGCVLAGIGVNYYQCGD